MAFKPSEAYTQPAQPDLPDTCALDISSADAVLLSEAYRFAQFSHLGLSEPVNAALHRLLNAVDDIVHPVPKE